MTRAKTKIHHTINTGDHLPTSVRPYYKTVQQRKKVQQERKPDGTYRFLVDFRRLNSITKKDSYPQPSAEELLHRLAGHQYFTKLDLKSGYFQMPIHESDIPKTAIITQDGLYGFTALAQGLMNAPPVMSGHICPAIIMLLNHLKTLPAFSGNQSEDAVQWLKDITDGLNYAEYTDDRKTFIISEYLKSDARLWLFGNLFVLDSWPIFIEEFKKEFAPTLLKGDAMSQVNECVYELDKTMLYCDNGTKEEHNCELFEEKEVHLDYSNIKLIELNNIVLLNTCIVESDENSCEMVWPDGCETWFIHDELPQRYQFIRSKQPDVPFNSTSNIDDKFSQENLLNCINVLSSSVMNDKYIFASYNLEAFGSPLKLHVKYSDIFSFFLFLRKLRPVINTCSRIFTGDTAGSYFCHDVMPYDTEDRDWFRCLAVP
ncbi:unnamed protein product [Rotaria socialis]|uniref:Reverse transcriptase domain-containing protein n=1 Tax=Rotaria socialis TaxID=392032 RepID=A0A821S1E4_9BILA|nr:unnamed protein product [Rotaria socialis]